MTNFERIKSMSVEELAEELRLIAEWDRSQVKIAKKYPQFYTEWLNTESKVK